MTNKELEVLAYKLRRDVVDIIWAGKAGHIGGDMSVMDVLVQLYFKHMNISVDNMDDDNRDRFILSKGHSVEALYAVLAEKGFFPLAEVKAQYSKFNTPYIGHPNNKLPGIEMNSGSLGHGLPVAVGMALAAKMDEKPYRVFTVMGDGELAEGSVWEGAMAASHYGLDNLCVIIDRNGLQISGTTEDVMSHENLYKRFKSFGWVVLEAKGNNMNSLDEVLTEATSDAHAGKPVVIIAHTTKGYGSMVMEGKPQWHHKVPNIDEYVDIIVELKKRKERAEYGDVRRKREYFSYRR